MLPLAESIVGSDAQKVVPLASSAQHPPAGNQPMVCWWVSAPRRHLFQIVRALHPSRGFARRLHRRKQERNQNSDDRNEPQATRLV